MQLSIMYCLRAAILLAREPLMTQIGSYEDEGGWVSRKLEWRKFVMVAIGYMCICELSFIYVWGNIFEKMRFMGANR
jgi:hypothetical protein